MKMFACILVLALIVGGLQGTGKPIIMTILYDNTAAIGEVQADWGFACLVEGLEQTILFDTGTKSELLLHNAKVLGKDLANVDIVVLSHDHRDHTGGLTAVLQRCPGATVYFPQSFPVTYDDLIQDYNSQPVRVKQPIKIIEGVALTGELGDRIKEQAMILETSRGSIVVTGCSHPGILNILERVREYHPADIALVFGGFHLMNHSKDQVNKIIARFREWDVMKVGATHCTGEQAIELFRQAYGENFVSMGVGQVLTIPL
jgi:7,8-dihydropterin-6-yl-methyl-4-(beta-D-ribofuranosyl)aminobenzene 5'-phosphate synthase